MQRSRPRPQTPIRRDGEPLSLAIGGAVLSFAPPIISAIINITERIHTIVVNYGSNQKDCLKLDDHVNEVVSYLQYLEYSPNMIDQLQQPLMNLEGCLIECYQFLEQYTSTHPLEQMVRSGHFKRKFDQINNELDQYKGRLTFAMNMTQMAIGRNDYQQISSSAIFADQQKRHKNLVQSRQMHNRSPVCSAKYVFFSFCTNLISIL